MKKYLVIALAPILLLSAGCSFTKNTDTKSGANTPIVSNSVCEIPVATSSMETKTGLPPVSQEERNKIFTYEDSEMGVKMQYPGSCYFNKGIFQCSDFTLSVWDLEENTPANSVAEKTYANGQTQIKYVYRHNNKSYSLMAWYDGEDKADLDKVIDTMAKSLTFTR